MRIVRRAAVAGILLSATAAVAPVLSGCTPEANAKFENQRSRPVALVAVGDDGSQEQVASLDPGEGFMGFIPMTAGCTVGRVEAHEGGRVVAVWDRICSGSTTIIT